MDEKEDAIADLISRISAHDDEPTVTRDWRKRANVKLFPMTIVLEHNDEATLVGEQPAPLYNRMALVSTVTFLQGSTGELAPAELAAYQKKLRELVYKDQRRRIGNYGAGIREQATSAVIFPPIGNNAVAQEIVWRIDYKEDTAQCFA